PSIAFHATAYTESYTLSLHDALPISTGCNFRCSWCQNWDISQLSDRNDPDRLPFTDPAQVVKAALKSGCQSVSYTYTEPTIFYEDRKSTRLNSSHVKISYAVFCLKKK